MAAKKIFVCIIVFVCIASTASIIVPVTFAGPCACGKQHYSNAQVVQKEMCNNDAWKKLGRGVANMLTFPLELPSQISKTNITDGPIAAFTWGLLKGVGMMGSRALVGVYETVTFPMPIPEGYEPILTDPEFFLEDQMA
jgi:putative exosortase-associated protein (TIGR04073 family)